MPLVGIRQAPVVVWIQLILRVEAIVAARVVLRLAERVAGEDGIAPAEPLVRRQLQAVVP